MKTLIKYTAGIVACALCISTLLIFAIDAFELEATGECRDCIFLKDR